VRLRPRWEDADHAKALSERVPRGRRRGCPPGRSPIVEVAKDFGIAESCLRNWLSAVDVGDGERPGLSAQESEQLRELKRRNRLLEQQNEVLRRAAAYLSQGILPK